MWGETGEKCKRGGLKTRGEGGLRCRRMKMDDREKGRGARKRGRELKGAKEDILFLYMLKEAAMTN